MGSAPHKEEALREKWAELVVLRQSAPSPPAKGQKPDKATIAAMKAHKSKERECLGVLSKEGTALLKRYEKALKRPTPKIPPASSGGGSEHSDERGQTPKVPPCVRWINDAAPQFWSQRRSCDHLATGWSEVARLFGLSMSVPAGQAGRAATEKPAEVTEECGASTK